MTPTPPAISVAVVSFNTREVLASCLASVRRTSPERVVVVDNASTDGTVEVVRRDFPEVHLIVNDTNEGYGRAANRAIAACDSPVVLLLNSDTIVEPNCLASLRAYLADHPQAAVVGPRLVNSDGSLQRSTYPFPSAADVVLGETGLHLVVRRIPVLRERFWRTWGHDAARRVPWVLGAALAIRRSAFDAVGGFDAAYFMYGEEVDLSRRLADLDFETHYAPVTTVVHLGGASTRQRREAMQREFVVSKGRYLRQHESHAATSRLLRTLRLIALARYLRDVVWSRLARDADARTRHARAAVAARALLAEGPLWRA